MNSRNGCGHDDSAVNITVIISYYYYHQYYFSLIGFFSGVPELLWVRLGVPPHREALG